MGEFMINVSFKEWLQLLGYTSTSVSGFPYMIQEFLFFLESQNINNIREVSAENVSTYFSLLNTHQGIQL